MKQKLQTLVGYLIVIGIIATLVAVILYWQNRPPGRYAHKIQDNILYKVVKVFDGDTLVVRVEKQDVTLRLIGIDTPEAVDPRKPVQCFGPEASAKAKELLLDKEIYIEKDAAKTYDVYGRVLAYAKLSDGTSYNKYMIENGFAREYTFNKEKYKYQKEFKEAEARATTARLGLWGSCTK